MSDIHNKQSENTKSQTALDEAVILDFWQNNNIFEKSVSEREGMDEFVFFDGPPFATGLPHYGHILPGTIKDVIPRYHTMRGKKVVRKWGWDCHGLPIENIIEKQLNLNSRKEILDYGIDKFNQAARNQVLAYKEAWEEIIPRTGRWVDMQDHYKTMDASYTESCWWAFKELDNKGLVYRGYKPMHMCPRCETTLSNNEVSEGYKDVTDISVTVKFELSDEPETYLLAWTTTPWTLPGNTAIAVGRDVVYLKVSVTQEDKQGNYIVAKERVADVMNHVGITEWEEVAVLGSDALIGRSYIPPYDYYTNQTAIEHHENGWKIWEADFVTDEAGTGIAHEAPAFGADDYYLAQENNIPMIHHIGADGRFNEEVTDFAGMLVKAKDDHQSADIEIIKNLAYRGYLFSKEKIVHSYPHCWRCDTPLLNFATSSWFIKTTQLRDRMLAENTATNWIPDHIGHKRFHNWIEGNIDWAVSRSRFWGAPLPVWENQVTREYDVIGSLEELKDKTRSTNNYIFVRHGESVGNTTGTISLAIDDEHDRLSETGKEQVANSCAEIKRILKEEAKNPSNGVDVVIHSPYNRTRQTAAMIAGEFGVDDLVPDERIVERNFGDGLSGTQYDDYYQRLESLGKTDDYGFRMEGGENYHDVKQRMMEFMKDIDETYEGKTIVVVTHFSPYWVAFAGAAGMNEQEMHDLRDNWGTVHNAKPRLLDYAPFPHDDEYVLDLHRPYSDRVTYTNDKGEEYRMIGEVFDCWYESGSMPYASKHYGPNSERSSLSTSPLADSSDSQSDSSSQDSSSRIPSQNSNLRLRGDNDFVYPADFICEAIDQTRGWFYSLSALGAGVFDQAPMKNVIVTGHVMAEDGKKMSKSLNNYPPVEEVLDTYGADALRYFLLNSPVMRGEKVNLVEKEIDEINKKIIMRLKNTYTFFETYQEGLDVALDPHQSTNPLDRWILSRLAQVHTGATTGLDNYELDRACNPILEFVDDLSTWYVRRSRDRFKADGGEDKSYAQVTTWHVLRETSKLLAPFMPFTADYLWMRVRTDRDRESVHLEHWSRPMTVNDDVLAVMKQVRETVSRALEARVSVGIKVRQPLQRLTIKDQDSNSDSFSESLQEIIKDELNVKEIDFADIKDEVVLDTNITPELQTEGDFREFVRNIQALRKRSGLSPHDLVQLELVMDEQGQAMINQYFAELEQIAGVSEVIWVDSLDSEEQSANEVTYRVKVEKM